MANIPKLEEDLSIISKLSDRPNEQGLGPRELKETWDQAGNTIKGYLNETLIPAIEGGAEGGGLVPEAVEKHNTSPEAHGDIRKALSAQGGKIDQHIASRDNPHNVTYVQVGADPVGAAGKVSAALTAHAEDQDNPHKVTAQQVGADPAGSAQAVQEKLDDFTNRRDNPHGVTAEQVGADPKGTAAAALEIAAGTVIAADCYDLADSPQAAPNAWYVPKEMPRPSGAVGTMVDVRWRNGSADGLGYDVTLIWGAPGGADNETILSKINTADTLTGEYSIPAEGTVRYQLEEKDGRKHWKYVGGKLIPRQFSTATPAAAADKQVPGMSVSYLSGMEVYVQLDAGNTAGTMRLIPDDGPALPVYGNGVGTKTGEIPAGYILHLVNAGDHWQMLDSYQAACQYADSAVATVPRPDVNKAYVNQQDATVLRDAKAYTNEQTALIPRPDVDKAYVNRRDADTLKKAKAYADGLQFTLPVAAADTLGGIKAEPATPADTQAVRIKPDGTLATAPSGGGGGGTVDSVNGRTGAVVLTAKDVGAATPEQLNEAQHTTMVVTAMQEGGGDYKADHTSTEIINHANAGGIVVLRYTDADGRTLEIRMSGQTTSREAWFFQTFKVPGENKVKRVDAKVDYAGSVSVTEETLDVATLDAAGKVPLAQLDMDAIANDVIGRIPAAKGVSF